MKNMVLLSFANSTAQQWKCLGLKIADSYEFPPAEVPNVLIRKLEKTN